MKLLLALLLAQQQPTFKTQAPLVVLPVTVSTKTGERIWGLTENDFELRDNGKQRKVTVEAWGTYESRVSLVVVIQTTTLSYSALLKVKKTVGMLDSITGEGGEVAIITTDSEIKTRLNFTSRWEPIQETFERLTAGDHGGRVLDAVDSAVAMLSSRPQGQRRLILVLSEARDRGSAADASDVLTHAQRENVSIYTATYSAYITPFTTKGADYQAGVPMAGGNLLEIFFEIAQATKQNMGKTLAEYTGGRQLGFNTLHGLEEDLAEIGKEIHSQYQLSFVPETEQSPIYHEINVYVKSQPGATIRTRPGYWNANPASDEKADHK